MARPKKFINQKVCKQCGKLKELLMFGRWGKKQICLTCEDENKEKEAKNETGAHHER